MENLRLISAAVYLASFISSLLYTQLSKVARAQGWALLAIFTLFIGWSLQGIELGIALKEGGLTYAHVPDAFELSAWVLAFCFLLFSLSTRFFRTSPFFLTAILLFLALSYIAGEHLPLAISFGSSKSGGWGRVHLLFSALGFAVLTLSGLLGTLYLFKEWSLKQKRWRSIENIPSLDRLYHLFNMTLWVGFIFFTAGVLSGSGWSKILYGVYLSNEPKEMLTLLTWAAYAILVNLQLLPNWRGRRTIIAFYFVFLLLISVLGISHRL